MDVHTTSSDTSEEDEDQNGIWAWVPRPTEWNLPDQEEVVAEHDGFQAMARGAELARSHFKANMVKRMRSATTRNSNGGGRLRTGEENTTTGTGNGKVFEEVAKRTHKRTQDQASLLRRVVRKRVSASRKPTTVTTTRRNRQHVPVEATPASTSGDTASAVPSEHLLESHRLSTGTSGIGSFVSASRQGLARINNSGPAVVTSMMLRTAAQRIVAKLDSESTQSLDPSTRQLITDAALLVVQTVEHAEFQRRVIVHQTMSGGSMWNPTSLVNGNQRPTILEGVPAAVQQRTTTLADMYRPSTMPSRHAPGPLLYQ